MFTHKDLHFITNMARVITFQIFFSSFKAFFLLISEGTVINEAHDFHFERVYALKHASTI